MSAVGALVASSAAWLTTAALLAVAADGFLPFLPSGSFVVAAVLATSDAHGSVLLLGVLVALASFTGDLLLLRCARSSAGWVQRRFARRPQWGEAAEFILETIRTRPARTVVIARMMPGGRTVLDMAVGTSANPPRHFLRWSALSAAVWATYIVGLGRIDEHWFDTDWLAFAVSTAAAGAVGALVARCYRRARRTAAPAPAPAEASAAPVPVTAEAG